MTASHMDLNQELALLVSEYRAEGQFAQLRSRLSALARHTTPDAVILAAEPYRDDPSVIAPLYEVVVERQPQNARAMVILANAWWLMGAGPDAVGDLAVRAKAIDDNNRGAWHLWALTESDPRARALRWKAVSERFVEDELALANLADNAASVASAEQDYEMLDLAVGTYEDLLSRATQVEQKNALTTALQALRGWKF